MKSRSTHERAPRSAPEVRARLVKKLAAQMQAEGLDVYLPPAKESAAGGSALVRRRDGSVVELRIFARPATVAKNEAALFGGIRHEERKNFFFVFYAERMDAMWIMSSEEFVSETKPFKTGPNPGRRAIWLNVYREKGGEVEEYPRPKLVKYLAQDFSRLKRVRN